MSVRFLSTALLCALAAELLPAQETPVLIRGARVFDGVSMLGVRDVLLHQGRITRLAPEITPPAGAQVVDGNGRTLLPGLIDAHTHTFGDALEQALAFGVTTEIDMFTEAGQASRWRAEQRSGQASARADIHSASILVTAPGGHGTQYGMPIPTIASPDSAQSFVDARIAEGSDFIKIVYDDGSSYALTRSTLNEATMRAVVAAARTRGKLAVVHIGSLRGAREAIEAGANGLVHINAEQPVDSAFIALAVARRAFIIPTLSVIRSVTGVAGGDRIVSDPRIDSALKLSDVSQLKQSFPARAGTTLRYENAEASVRALSRAGVAILAGTDAPNPGTTHGASMHGEIEFLVGAGLTPVQALAAATSVPAQAFRLDDRGRIAEGMRADVILVAGDPTADISATRSIVGIWKSGVRFDRASYARRAAETRVAAAAPRNSESGVVSTFEDGTTSSVFGLGWEVSTDQMAGGKSAAQLEVVDGGANGSAKALRITGSIDPALPYAWSGAVFSPAEAAMRPANLSSKKEIAFWARGDGKSYRVMLFSQSRGMTPMLRPFQVTAEWKEYVFPLAAFGTDGKDLTMLLVVGGPAPGPFEITIDDVRFR